MDLAPKTGYMYKLYKYIISFQKKTIENTAMNIINSIQRQHAFTKQKETGLKQIWRNYQNEKKKSPDNLAIMLTSSYLKVN